MNELLIINFGWTLTFETRHDANRKRPRSRQQTSSRKRCRAAAPPCLMERLHLPTAPVTLLKRPPPTPAVHLLKRSPTNSKFKADERRERRVGGDNVIVRSPPPGGRESLDALTVQNGDHETNDEAN